MGKDVIVACDFASAEATFNFLDKFENEDRKPFVKIGMELFYAAGPDIVRELVRLGVPFQSAYAAAKHAVEGYAECLQMEVSPLGVQVCLIEPGDHRSGSQAYRAHAAAMSDESPYAENYRSSTYVIHRDETGGSDPDKLGRKVAALLRRKRLPFRKCIAKADQHLAVWMHRLLPWRINQWSLQSYYFGKDPERGREHGTV